MSYVKYFYILLFINLFVGREVQEKKVQDSLQKMVLCLCSRDQNTLSGLEVNITFHWGIYLAPLQRF